MNKTWKIIYYLATGFLSVSFLLGAYGELARQQSAIDLFTHLGYPLYLLCIIGVAKILAVIGIWQPKWPTLREWAYAGIFIELIGAVASHLLHGDPIQMAAPAFVVLVVAILSYVGLKKHRGAMRMAM